MACRVVVSLRKAVSTNTLTYSRLKTWHIQSASYAVKPVAKKGGGAATSKKKQLEVETDPNLLCTRLCGGNIKKEGEDPVLGPDENYPEWLWNLQTTHEPIPLEELDEDDIRYWRRLRRLTLRSRNSVKGTKLM